MINESVRSFAIDMSMNQAQSPLITDWISAIGQVAGAVGTFAAVALALWLASKENGRLIAERRDSEAADARLVVASVRHDIGISFLEVRNDGSAPVYQLEFGDVTSGAHTYVVTESIVDYRGGRYVAEATVAEMPMNIAPKESVRLALKLPSGLTRPDRILVGRASISYTDSKGLRWKRCGYDSPQRILS